MSLPRTAVGLPLLGKELIEQSSRRRTYIVRVVYAVLLFGFAILIFAGEVYSRSANQLDMLGRGKQMFMILYLLELVGILLFTPALTCAAITTEKERNTFGLLLLTKLGPTTILLEKYLSRIVVMTTYLLLCLPLFGFCYALGGVDQVTVWAAFFSLFATLVQLSALGLFCSCWCRTTVGAFIGSYLIGFLMLFGPLIAVSLFRFRWPLQILEIIWIMVDQFVLLLGRIGAVATSALFRVMQTDPEPVLGAGPVWTTFAQSDLGRVEALSFLFFSPVYVLENLDSPFRSIIPWRLFFAAIPGLATAILWLLAARAAIVVRAFAVPRRYLMRLFRSLDGLFERLNRNRFTKGIVLIDSNNRLPGDDPVAWRETTKSPLGTVQYLVRVFIAIQFPVAALCMLAIAVDSGDGVYRQRHTGLTAILTIVWLLTILLVSVKGATLIAGERSRETLDVLLSTPISGRELVRQKFMGVRRLILMLTIPLLTVVAAQAWVASLRNAGFFGSARDGFSDSAVCYAIVQVATVLIMPSMIAWLSFLIGLWMKTSTRAIFTSLAVLTAWIVLPFPVLISCFELFNIRPGDWPATLLMSSPAAMPLFTEVGELDDLTRWANSLGMAWGPVILYVLAYGAILFGIRRLALVYAGQLLGRAEREN